MSEAEIHEGGRRHEKTAGPTPCRPWKSYSELLSVYGFLQFGPRGKFRDFACGDLDGCAGLRVAAVARLSLRNREGAEANQRHAISLAESSSNAIDSSINGGRGLCF